MTFDLAKFIDQNQRPRDLIIEKPTLVCNLVLFLPVYILYSSSESHYVEK